MNPQTPTVNGQQLDPKILKVFNALRLSEGGDYNNRSGDGGSSAGAFQWNNDKTPLKPGEIPK